MSAARLTLKKALTTGAFAAPMACLIAAEGLRREGHEVYVLPAGAGGSRLRATLVIELHGPTRIDLEACPGALLVRDGILPIIYQDAEQFAYQEVDWSRRRWVGGTHARTIAAPVVSAQLIGARARDAGTTVYWTVQRSEGEAWLLSQSRLDSTRWMFRDSDARSEARYTTRGWLITDTMEVFDGDEPQPAPASEPARGDRAKFERDAVLARQTAELAILRGWRPALPRGAR